MKKIVILAIGLFITSINVFAQEKARKNSSRNIIFLCLPDAPKLYK
jgi:hypothetical protein